MTLAFSLLAIAGAVIMCYAAWRLQQAGRALQDYYDSLLDTPDEDPSYTQAYLRRNNHD